MTGDAAWGAARRDRVLAGACIECGGTMSAGCPHCGGTGREPRNLRWFYMSFADREGGGFLGGCYVQGESLPDAIDRSHRMGINPGGEVMSGELTDEMVERVRRGYVNRLLTRDEIDDSVQAEPVTYRIVRFYSDRDHPDHQTVVGTGLTLAEAKEHCTRPDTREEDPATGETVWFDGFERE